MSKAQSSIRTMALVLTCMLAGASLALGNFDDGQRAWDAGRPNEALVHWQAAAEDGDRRAMLALGHLYLKGLGAPQDYVEAHKWFNLAASRGDVTALEERDALAAKMTTAQVALAQERAATWRSRKTPTVASTGSPDPGGRVAGPPPPRAIKEAQTLLSALGYAPGAADGVWGRRSARAYQAFLRDAGLAPEDSLTPRTLTALRAAAGRRASGASPDASGRTGPSRPVVGPDDLHRAAKAGDLDGLKAVLEAGAAVDARDGAGRTALMHVVDRGYVLLVEPLLAAGANLDVQAPDGATALFIATVHGHTQIIERLMESGADISIRGPRGRTAVDVARVKYGEPDTVREKGGSPAIIGLVAGDSQRMLSERRRLEEQSRKAERTRRAREEARRKDDSAFAQAMSLGTIRAYKEYLRSNSSGRHAEEAREQIADARRNPKPPLKGPLLEAAKKSLSRALSLAAKTPSDNTSYILGLGNIGLAQHLLGDTHGAERSFSRALSAAEKLASSLEYGVPYAYISIATLQAEWGDVQGAERSISRARAHLPGVSDLYGYKTNIMAMLGRALATVGDIQGAKRFISRALSNAETFGNEYAQQITAFTFIAMAQSEVGDVQGAKRSISKALAGTGGSRFDHLDLGAIVRAQADLGNVHGAMRTAGRIRYSEAKVQAFTAIALAQAEAGDARAAGRSISEVLSKVEQLDIRYGVQLYALSEVALARARLATPPP